MNTLIPIPQPTGTNGFDLGDLTMATPPSGPIATPGSSTSGTSAIPLLFFPEDKAPNTVYASVIDYDGTDATFLVNCPSKTCSTDFPERTVVQGDDGWSEYVVIDETTTYRMCSETGGDDVVCGVQSGKNLKTAAAVKDLKPTSTYNECWGAQNFRVAQVTGGVEKMADETKFDNNGLVADADTVQKLLDYRREESSCSATSSAKAPKKTGSANENESSHGDDESNNSKDDEGSNSKVDEGNDSKDDEDSGALRLSFSNGLMAFLGVSALFAVLA